MSVSVLEGDCRELMGRLLALDTQFDAVVTDPPYHLQSINKRFAKTGRTESTERYAVGAYGRHAKGFMGKQWDGGDIAYQPETWRLVFELLKPGGHLLAFGSTRGHHRMFCAIEDAGFEIRDTVCWLYGSGFPKSHDVAKGIDKAAGADREVLGVSRNGAGPSKMKLDNHGEGDTGIGYMDGSGKVFPITAPATDAAREWHGWGTALKPAYEPICVARKPLIGTIAANVLTHGTGALNIDGTRIQTADDLNGGAYAENGNRSVSPSLHAGSGMNVPGKTTGKEYAQPLGRWPANVVHDGSDEVIAAFPESGPPSGNTHSARDHTGGVFGGGRVGIENIYKDEGSAARFFYSAKADATDRLGSKHPTVKPMDLMRWLVRLVTPKGGLVLDPFAGTGTTGMACMAEGMRCILIEREAEYVADIKRRIAHVSGQDAPLFASETA